MPEFVIDRRDYEFLLFEHHDLMALASLPAYKDFDRDDFQAILDAAHTVVAEALWPTNEAADRAGCRLVDGQVKIPTVYHDAFRQWAEGGWIASARPTDVGGMGLPFPLTVLITEMSIAGSSSFVFFPGLSVAAGHLLESFASESMRDAIVPRLYSGEWAGSMCLTEPQAGTAVGDISTTATPIKGSDEYLIKGNKIFISAGDHDLTENIVHLVLARVPGDPEGTKGISLFAVPKVRFDAHGKLLGPNDVIPTAVEEKMGIHGSPTVALAFGENGECRGRLVGQRAQGIVYMFQMMNEARIVTGIQGAACANIAYQWALAYARERIQSPKATERSGRSVPIIEHPDVRRNLMLCKAYSEGIRALLVRTAFHEAHAQYATDESERTKNRDLVDLLTPICKAYATDIGFRVTELAMQIHGGYGYIREYGVERLMRDVKIASIYEGTNGVQALDLLGRKMRLKDGALFMTWMMGINDTIEQVRADERLAREAEHLEEAKNLLGQVAFGFGAQAKQHPELPLLGATPFLEMFGHIEVARLLLEQALIAAGKLDALVQQAGAGTAVEDLVSSDGGASADARFYDGKIKTAKFFVNTILPHAHALGRSISNGDRSALEIAF